MGHNVLRSMLAAAGSGVKAGRTKTPGKGGAGGKGGLGGSTGTTGPTEPPDGQVRSNSALMRSRSAG